MQVDMYRYTCRLITIVSPIVLPCLFVDKAFPCLTLFLWILNKFHILIGGYVLIPKVCWVIIPNWDKHSRSVHYVSKLKYATSKSQNNQNVSNTCQRVSNKFRCLTCVELVHSSSEIFVLPT